MPVVLFLLFAWLGWFSRVGAADHGPPPPAAAAGATDDPLKSLDAAQVQELLQWLSRHASDPAAFSQDELNRAALRSLLRDSRTGAEILPAPAAEAPSASALPPLHARLGATAAYVRAGALTAENVAALADFLTPLPAEVATLILDLRAPQPPGPLAGAAGLASLFLAEKTPLFAVHAPPTVPTLHAAGRPPAWTRRVWLLIDDRTPPPAALAAHLLDRHMNVLTFGSRPSGALAETTDRPLGTGQVILLPAATVTWPDGTRLTGTPLNPKVAITPRPDSRQALLSLTDPASLPSHLAEIDRPRPNEAALMAGIPSELLSLETSPPNAIRPDPVLQQAMDLIQTTVLLKLDVPEEIKRAQPGR